MPSPFRGNVVRCRTDVPRGFVPRARYALSVLLEPLGLDPLWLGPEDATHAEIYYGPGSIDGPAVHLPFNAATAEFFVRGGRLQASEVRSMEIAREQWPILFAEPAGQPDVVASTFYLVSGWHEATSVQRDEHGRVPFAGSIQAELGIVLRPVVDAYRLWLTNRLERAGVQTRRRDWGSSQWAFCPTHDIDYLRKWRPGIIYRELVHHLLLNRRNVRPIDRLRRAIAAAGQALGGADPFRSALSRIPDEVLGRNGRSTFFMKTGAGDPHDVPYRLAESFVRGVLDRLERDGFEIGLHPSYRTATDSEMLRRECERLVRAVSRQPVSVRHHYLRFDPRETPARLHRAGFRIDSTLGFAEHEGFRRSTCLPFRLYDLERDEVLNLWEMPLTFMDGTLFNRRRMDAEQALEAAKELMNTCHAFGGVCVGLWHNTLWDELDFPGWGRHFTESLDYAADRGGLITTLRDALASWLGAGGSSSS